MQEGSQKSHYLLPTDQTHFNVIPQSLTALCIWSTSKVICYCFCFLGRHEYFTAFDGLFDLRGGICMLTFQK